MVLKKVTNVKTNNLLTQIDSFVWKLFLIFVFILPLQVLQIKLDMRAIYICDFVFLALFLAWCANKITVKIKLPPKLILYAIACLLASQILSTFLSEDVRKSAVSLVGKLYLFAMLFITYDLVRTREQVRSLMRTLLFSCFIVIGCGFIGIILFYTGITNPFQWGYGGLAPGNFPRLQSTLQGPQELSLYFSIYFFLILGFMSFLYPQKKKLTIMILCAFSIIAFFSVSRDIYGIFSGATFFMFLLWRRKQIFCGTAVSFSTIFAIIIFVFFNVTNMIYILPLKIKNHANKETKNILFDYEFGKNSQPDKEGWVDDTLIVINTHKHNKVYYIYDLINTLKEKPLYGIGIGLPGSKNNLEKIHADMHNAYFQILVQQGYTGAIAGLFFLFTIARFSFQKLKEMTGSEFFMFSCLFAAYAALLGSSFFSHHLNNRIIWLTFAVMLTFGSVLTNTQKSDKKEQNV